MGPGPQIPDGFHPDVDPVAEPATPGYGGTIRLHLPELARNFNRALDNTETPRWVMYAMHDFLLHQDWETWALEPRLAESYRSQDAVVLRPEAAERYPEALELTLKGKPSWRLWGDVEETGEGYLIRMPLGHAGALTESRVPMADVLSLERGTVFTFKLREGVLWHDGHPFDAEDVLFSWQCLRNPYVNAEQTRSLYGKLLLAEIPEPGVIRFFYGNQFYSALETVGEMPILPRHLFDLNDPDLRAAHPDAFAGTGEASAEEVGRFVNRNPHNADWVGLGPSKLTSRDQTGVVVERFDDYWDAHNPKYGGYLDRIIWRYIRDPRAALQAVLSGDLDFYSGLSTVDYYGATTESETFRSKLYKGNFYTGTYNYVGWNALLPFFEEASVRRALGHLVDLERLSRSLTNGLSLPVSGPPHYFSQAYDHSISQPEFDPEKAVALLEEAGWYDHDGDGIIDRDGETFEFELLVLSASNNSSSLAAEIQSSLAKAGIKMHLVSMDFASLVQRIRARDFEAYSLSWVLDLESDPEQVWHSKWADEEQSSNFVSYADAESDRLIEAIQVELNVPRRMELWHRLHARIAEQQPYLFVFNNPYLFAMSKRFRGMRTSAISPGFSIRQIYLPLGTEGTRATPER